jgi:nucleoside-diphosphate-sugar epimerase
MTVATSHAAQPSTRTSQFRYSLDDLVGLDAESLRTLYEQASVPKIGDLRGDLEGRMLTSPLAGERLAGVMRSLGRWERFPWRGKSFSPRDDARGEGINRVFSESRARARSTRSSSTTTTRRTRSSFASSKTKFAPCDRGSSSGRRGSRRAAKRRWLSTSRSNRATDRMDGPTLVTGAGGFLGGRIARLLVARGESVRALDVSPAALARLSPIVVEHVRADITDRRAVDAAVRGCARVIHVAALYELGTRDPARMAAINVGGTENVLGAAAAIGIPSVHVSSVAALGPTGRDPANESHWNPETPRSAYDATKRAAHEHARRLMRDGARVRIAMPATIFGAGDPSMIGRAHAWLARGRVRVGVRPDMRLAFVHVDDCADGVVRVADRGADGGEYILSSANPTLGEWFDAFARVSGRPAPRVVIPSWLVDAAGAAAARLPPRTKPLRLLRDAAAMSKGVDWCFSGDKARSDLGWSPRTFDEGLADVVAALEGRAPHAQRSRTSSPGASASV